MRCFIAIDLPAALRSALQQWQSTCRPHAPKARWVRPEGIHLTLQFLGEVPADRVRNVEESLRSLAAFESFTVQVEGFGFFPDARRPRVFWVGMNVPEALAALQQRVEAATASLGFPAQDRAFMPHLTVARFREPQPQPALQQFLSRQPAPSFGSIGVSEFYLFESKLAPQGAQYRRLAQFPRKDATPGHG
jgi:RNA 2',3'-cyclic 3'-phosphodiesterase